MPLQNGEATIKFILRLSSDLEDMICTLGISRAGLPDSGQLIEIYDSFSDAWINHLATVYTFRGINIRGKTDAGTDYETELLSNAVGTNAIDPIPQNCAVLVQKRTGLPGRANRGRFYIPGCVGIQGVEPNGQLTPATQGAFQTSASTMMNRLLDEPLTGIRDVIVQHPTAPGTRITAFVVDDAIATQRRRLR